MRRHLLITGHTGFIGGALTSAFRRNSDFQILGASRSNGRNLLDFKSLQGLPKLEKIVHLAGLVGVLQSWRSPLEVYQTNIVSVLNILELARIHQTPVVYVSSYVYGSPEYLPIDEAHPVNCENPYALSKREGELLCEAYFKDFGVPVAILRPFNLYGPGQTREYLIPSMICQAKENDFIQVKDLRPKRDYLYISDMIEALQQVIYSEQRGLEIYNIGSGKSYSVREVIDTVLNLTGRDIPVYCSEERRRNEIMDCYSNSKKFSEKFFWKPQVSLEKGVEQLLDGKSVLQN